MRTSLVSKKQYGKLTRLEYVCPCGRGTVVEVHNQDPYVREHSVKLFCEECEKVFRIDDSLSVAEWEIVKKV